MLKESAVFFLLEILLNSAYIENPILYNSALKFLARFLSKTVQFAAYSLFDYRCIIDLFSLGVLEAGAGVPNRTAHLILYRP